MLFREEEDGTYRYCVSGYTTYRMDTGDVLEIRNDSTRFNGMSVPNWLRPFTELTDTKYLMAAYFHDMLYLGKGIMRVCISHATRVYTKPTRSVADRVLFELLEDLGAPFMDRWLAWAYVRLFNKHKWRGVK